MKAKTPYQFTIINLSKPNSQFNFGMQPVFYSSEDKTWSRIGEKISYFKNHYAKPTSADKAVDDPSDDTYCSLTFTITFPYENDFCFIAYHYPYSYSYQQVYNDVDEFEKTVPTLTYDLFHRPFWTVSRKIQALIDSYCAIR